MDAGCAPFPGLSPSAIAGHAMTSLTGAEIQALHDALDDEYHAWSVYSQVLQDFEPVRPFLNIRDSELRHIQALHQLFRLYGLPIPGNPWSTATVPRFASLKAASEAGVQVEIDNVDLYRRILGATERPEILQVFRRLQAASWQCHLPAFQRAAARYGAQEQSPAGSDAPPVPVTAGRRHRGGRGGCSAGPGVASF
jgi:hypothetical protein